ncbi:Encodes a protein whose expression is responsive to nematode infection [Forsythia ovata]|uniref:Encodes a protein whose expression is responsive to nematode infection n=1 Tax=Forsythia ovata TaxID=205694 RepID=A0ABD1XAZ0_9LAMI
MGNSLGGKKTAKVMKINGEMIKFKTPVNVGDIMKDYPGYVLLESEAVKHFGIRAMPLESQQELKSKRLYFLVELPEFPQDKGARRVRSGIHMTAKDRLESLMLAKRSVSDLSIMKPPSMAFEESVTSSENGAMRLKMRLPKAQVDKLMMESKDGTEIAEKIVNLYMAEPNKVLNQHVQWKNDDGIVKIGHKSREKRVGFLPVGEGEIQLAVA